MAQVNQSLPRVFVWWRSPWLCWVGAAIAVRVEWVELNKPCLAQGAFFTGGLVAHPATRKITLLPFSQSPGAEVWRGPSLCS